MVPQLLYGAEIWGYSNVLPLEVVQNSFLKSLLIVPKGTPAPFLRAETWLISLQTSVHVALARYWLKLASMSNTWLLKNPS